MYLQLYSQPINRISQSINFRNAIVSADVEIPVAVLCLRNTICKSSLIWQIMLNALIIPVTVPNNPARVPKDTIVESMCFSNIGISNEVTSSISLWIVSAAASLSKPSL
jgi:hypothetical protein